jgi:copper transport protein
LAAIGPATAAGAHALVGSSDPPNGVRLDEPPQAVTITFTEPPDPELSFIEVQGPEGTGVHEGPAEVVTGRPQTLRVPLGDLEEGVYTITWRVVSQVDGHATAGFLSFGVGVSPADAPGGPPVSAPDVQRTSLLEMAARWTLFVGLGLLIGAAWVGAAAFKETPSGILTLMLAGLAGAVLGLVGLAVAQQQAAGVGFGSLVGTSVGRALLWRAAGIVAAAAAAIVAVRSPAWRRPALAAAAVAAGLAMLAHVAAGHAASGSFRWAKVAAQWAHFAGAGVWLGGLTALIVGIRGRPDERKALAVRRFSMVAGASLAVVAVTGVVRAVNEVGGWGPLFSTSYGWVVLLKSGLLLPLVAFGAINRYRNVPVAGRSLRGLRLVSRAELGVAAVILGAAAVLASLVPPVLIPPPAEESAPLVASGSDFATTVQTRLDVEPGIPGPNRFLLRLTDYDTAEPLAGDRVALRFSFPARPELGESTLELSRTGRGLYAASGPNLAFAGPWDVTVLVQRGVDSMEVPLRLGTLCRTEVVEAPPEPTIYIQQLPTGGRVDALLDPGELGRNDVHFTFIDETENEIPTEDDPVMTAWLRPGEPTSLNPERLGAGHFTAPARLEPGRWRFDIAGSTESGDAISGCFETTID